MSADQDVEAAVGVFEPLREDACGFIALHIERVECNVQPFALQSFHGRFSSTLIPRCQHGRQPMLRKLPCQLES